MKKVTVSQYLELEDTPRVSPATVRRWIDNGYLIGEQLPSGMWLVHLEESEDLLERMLGCNLC